MGEDRIAIARETAHGDRPAPGFVFYPFAAADFAPRSRWRRMRDRLLRPLLRRRRGPDPRFLGWDLSSREVVPSPKPAPSIVVDVEREPVIDPVHNVAVHSEGSLEIDGRRYPPGTTFTLETRELRALGVPAREAGRLAMLALAEETGALHRALLELHATGKATVLKRSEGAP